ncbi:MAG: folate-binding protein YgfZ, partial [Myxococcota bacterium]|nr:folate-binding protein YgfZ [Myxococcota bacterium]
GVPRFGADFDDQTYPQEASLETTAVSFDKGCYLGQEVVCMLEMRGHVKRKLVSVVIDAAEPPPAGADVHGQGGASAAGNDGAGEVIGKVTSAAASPGLGKIVGLAMMKRAHSVPGTRITVAGASAKVVDRPA